MIQGENGARFLQETGDLLTITIEVRGQQFQGHSTTHLVGRQVDFAHASRAQKFFDLVLAHLDKPRRIFCQQNCGHV